jgi:hypothetical protein
MSSIRLPRCLPALAIGALAAFASLPAAAQSDASQASADSIAPSMELASIALEAVPMGSRLVVKTIEIAGASELVTVSVAATGASFVVSLAAETVSALGLAAGAVLDVSVVAGGWLLSADGAPVCFVPDDDARTLIHRRELDS